MYVYYLLHSECILSSKYKMNLLHKTYTIQTYIVIVKHEQSGPSHTTFLLKGPRDRSACRIRFDCDGTLSRSLITF